MNEKSPADIIIISYNNANLTLQCIDSIYNSGCSPNFGIILVDNASEDDTIERVSVTFPAIRIIRNEVNMGYANAVNAGVNASQADFIIVSNNDVIFHEKSIATLISTLVNDRKTGIAGPQQVFPDNVWQRSYGNPPGVALALGNFLMLPTITGFLKKSLWGIWSFDVNIKKVSYLDGAVLAISKQAYTETGGFDEDYFFYTEEADFCYRLRKHGWNVVFCPDALVTHLRGADSRNLGLTAGRIKLLVESKVLFCRKNLSQATTILYIFSEIFRHIINMSILKILAVIPGKIIKAKINNRLVIHDFFYQNWKRFL